MNPEDPGDKVTDGLVGEIEASPEDEGPQLVIADWLQSQGDPRGELIILAHREKSGGELDLAALERLLFLASDYGFPRSRPEDDVLPFVGRSNPVRYTVHFGGRNYIVRFADGTLIVDLEDGDANLQWELGGRVRLAFGGSNAWTEEQADLILPLVSDAIRAQTPIRDLWFPFDPDPLPTYDGGPRRAYRVPVDFRTRYGLHHTRYGIAARDLHRWLAIWGRLRSEL